MFKDVTKLTLILICPFLFLGVSFIYPDEALYYYHSLSNGRVVNNSVKINSEFAITEKRDGFVFLIRNIGHQKEQIVVAGKADWNFNYESAKKVNAVVELSTPSEDCIAYQKNKNSNLIPDYTYYFPKLNMFLLVYGMSKHLDNDIAQFCEALKEEEAGVTHTL